MNAHEPRKRQALRHISLAASLALASVWLAGCHTTVYQQGDRAAASSRAAAIETQTQSQTLAATMTTLSNLVYLPTADLKPQFQSFSLNLDRLVAAAQEGGVRDGQLVRSNSAYFAAWSGQLTTITNADVRRLNEARRTEVCDQFNAAHRQYVQAQSALWSLVHYLQDIRRALNTDLTAGGVQAVKPLVSTAGTNASNVQASLTEARADLTALSSTMSSSSGKQQGWKTASSPPPAAQSAASK